MNKKDAQTAHRMHRAHELAVQAIDIMQDESVQREAARAFPSWTLYTFRAQQTNKGDKLAEVWVTLCRPDTAIVLYAKGPTVKEAVLHALSRKFGQLYLPIQPDEDLPF